MKKLLTLLVFGFACLFSKHVLADDPMTVPAIEYYHAEYNHYFITADPVEISLLDEGVKLKGWKRTGEQIIVYPPEPKIEGAVPICRFYGLPEAGIDSHFYSASPKECLEVQEKFPGIWVLESFNVFQVKRLEFFSNSGLGCNLGSMRVFRLWNNRYDTNHRYTTSKKTQAEMVDKGYVAEGEGTPPAIFCTAPSKQQTREKFLSLVNEIRSTGTYCDMQTLDPPVQLLKWDYALETAAFNHSTDMLENNFFDHKGSDGSSFSGRAYAAGFNGQASGENIAGAYVREEDAFGAWRTSIGHCVNMMFYYPNALGVMYAKSPNGGIMWTMVLGMAYGITPVPPNAR